MSLVIILLCNQRFCVRDSHFDNQLGLQTSNVRFIRWFLSIYEILMYVFEFSEFSLFFSFLFFISTSSNESMFNSSSK